MIKAGINKAEESTAPVFDEAKAGSLGKEVLVKASKGRKKKH